MSRPPGSPPLAGRESGARGSIAALNVGGTTEYTATSSLDEVAVFCWLETLPFPLSSQGRGFGGEVSRRR